MPVFSFPDNNFSNYQWIFAKLGMCIDIVEIYFGIANGQISLIFDGVICQDMPVFLFPNNKMLMDFDQTGGVACLWCFYFISP